MEFWLETGRSPTKEPSLVSGLEPLLGYFTLDGSKNLQNGVATSNLNGLIASETFFGTYTVNPDRTGTLSVAVFAAGAQILAVTLNVVFDSDMRHMRRLFTSAAMPNGAPLATVIILDVRKE
jgi:hypothetical protein